MYIICIELIWVPRVACYICVLLHVDRCRVRILSLDGLKALNCAGVELVDVYIVCVYAFPLPL